MKKIIIIVISLICVIAGVFGVLHMKNRSNTENNNNGIINSGDSNSENNNQGLDNSAEIGDVENRVTIGIRELDNMQLVDKFIDNTNKFNNKRSDDKIEIVTYTIEGDEIITTLEYKDAEGIIVLTRDNTRDEFASEENRKIVTRDFSFPEYRLAKIVKDEYVHLALISDDDTYNIGSYRLTLENENDTSKMKVKDVSLKAKDTSIEELVCYDGKLYGKAFAAIDYAPNPDGPVGIINKLVGSEYLPTATGETNSAKLLNCYVDESGENSLILNINGTYELYSVVEY